jgi:hypothetical protein
MIIHDLPIAAALVLLERVAALRYDDKLRLNRFSMIELHASIEAQLAALPELPQTIILTLDDRYVGHLITYLATLPCPRAEFVEAQLAEEHAAFERLVHDAETIVIESNTHVPFRPRMVNANDITDVLEGRLR